jgi:hypothetical protein
VAVRLKRVVVRPARLIGNLLPGKVIVQGLIHKQVFYIDAGGVVRHFGGDFPFTHMMEVPGAAPGMLVQLWALVEAVESRLLPEGRIELKVVLAVTAKVTEPEVLPTAVDPAGDLVRAQQLVGEAQQQLLVPVTVTLPEPAEKIDSVRDLIEGLVGTAGEDEVSVDGLIHKQVFFVDESGAVRHALHREPFALTLPVPGARPGDNVALSATISHASETLLDPVTLVQQVAIAVEARVTKTVEIAVATDPLAPLYKLDHVVAEGHGQALASPSQLELHHPAVAVDDVSGRILRLVGTPVTDGVVVQGRVAKTIAYRDQDGHGRTQQEEVSVAALVLAPGAREGLDLRLQGELEPISFHFDPPHTLTQSVVVGLEATVTEHRQLRLLGDPAGPPLVVERVVSEATSQLLAEDIQDLVPVRGIEVTRIRVEEEAEVSAQILVCRRLPLDALKIRRIETSIDNLTHHIINGNVLVEGTLRKQVYFVGLDNIVHHVEEEVPFSHLLELPPGMPGEVEVRAEVENIVFSLANGVLDQKVVLLITVSSRQVRELEVVIRVFGPGITRVETALIFVFVVPEGVTRFLEVVTDVEGPAVVSVSKTTIVVPVSPDPEPRPIDVVTGVVLAPL